MALIEGVGDEVTVFVILLLLSLILCLAWISTSVPDLGGIRVIILDHTNFHRLGEIARRYQIIGYQIISGHIVHNNNNENQDQANGGDSTEVSATSSATSGDEDGEGEEHENLAERGAIDEIEVPESLGESSGEDDLHDLTSGFANSVSSLPDGVSRYAVIETNATQLSQHDNLESTQSHSPNQSGQSEAAAQNQACSSHDQLTDGLCQEGSKNSEGRTNGSSIQCRTENDVSATSDNRDSNELRRRRLAFFEKSYKSDSEKHKDISVDCSAAVDSISVAHSMPSSELNTPQEEGSSVDGATSIGNGSADEQSHSIGHSVAMDTEPPSQSATDMQNLSVAEGHIRVKIKYLDDRQRQVEAKPDDTIGEFKRRHFAGELAENMLVRFIYNGRELRQDGSTLQSCNITDGSVIHCLLTQGATQTDDAVHHQAQDREFNMGSLMFPLFGLILGLIWYCRFTYRTYFNAMSTLSLIGITFMYLIATMAVYRNHDNNHEHVD